MVSEESYGNVYVTSTQANRGTTAFEQCDTSHCGLSRLMIGGRYDGGAFYMRLGDSTL